MPNARLLLPIVIAVALVGAAQADRTTGDGVYVASQADSGATVFEAACFECHLPNWEKESNFYANWHGKPLLELVRYLHLEMPQTDPGTLSAEEYAQVTAYLLRLTGNPAGTTALAADTTLIGNIRIDTLRSTR
jgi:mono/diheme cytochrome c family protein